MKPQSLTARDRIRERQDEALEAIRLAHEKEAWVPIEPFEAKLLTDEILEKSNQMLEGMVGKQ